MTFKTFMLAGVASATVLAFVPFGPLPAVGQNTYVAPDQGQSGENQPQQMRKRQQCVRGHDMICHKM